ncbi:MAG TPA: hypothetical protein VGR85_04590 [Candidatus Limnocylindria bacterium]|jgi:hypothetical protein|nr:hypothetical protein [Candidatus Limnocylindria bacterium]
MRIFTVIAAAAGLVLSVAVAYAHEPPEWTSDLKDGGGPPAWVEDVKTDGGPPAFVETSGGAADEDAAIDEEATTDEEATEGAAGENSANVPEWVADVKADGGPPAWVEDVKADGGPPAWVEDVRTTPAAATASQKRAVP